MEPQIRNSLPHVHWSAVALGALLAVGGRILFGMLSAGLRADDDVSSTWPALVMVLAALLTSFIGAVVAVRAAGSANIRNAYVHGLAAFSLSLVVLAAWLRPFFLVGHWDDAQAGLHGISPWSDVVAMVMGLLGALAGSAVGRRNVLGQPAFTGEGLEPLRTRWSSLRRDDPTKVTSRPRPEDGPHDNIHH